MAINHRESLFPWVYVSARCLAGSGGTFLPSTFLPSASDGPGSARVTMFAHMTSSLGSEGRCHRALSGNRQRQRLLGRSEARKRDDAQASTGGEPLLLFCHPWRGCSSCARRRRVLEVAHRRRVSRSRSQGRRPPKHSLWWRRSWGKHPWSMEWGLCVFGTR